MMSSMELQCQMSHLRIEEGGGKVKKMDKYINIFTWCVSLLPDHVESPSVIPP